jgi:nucleoporin NUP1
MLDSQVPPKQSWNECKSHYSVYHATRIDVYIGEDRRSMTPLAASEKAFLELEVFKRPLVPTRMRMDNDSGVPELLRQSRVNVPVPEPSKKHRRSRRHRDHDDDEDQEIGKLRSGKKERKIKDSKPYAGEGGAKKLLARRKKEAQEEEQEAQEEQERSRMQDSPIQKPATAQPSVSQQPAVSAFPKSAFEFPPSSSLSSNATAGPSTTFESSIFAPGAPSEGSSLRVGRSKENRAHRTESARPRKPVTAATAGGRFSAALTDDMDDDDSVEIAEPPVEPLYKAPSGFSFAPPAAATAAEVSHLL